MSKSTVWCTIDPTRKMAEWVVRKRFEEVQGKPMATMEDEVSKKWNMVERLCTGLLEGGCLVFRCDKEGVALYIDHTIKIPAEVES